MIKNNQQYLIEKCKENDSKAQMQLYELYCDAMFNTAYNLVQDEALAQDLMQESFIKAFKKIDLFNGKATFGAWLKRMQKQYVLKMKQKAPYYSKALKIKKRIIIKVPSDATLKLDIRQGKIDLPDNIKTIR